MQSVMVEVVEEGGMAARLSMVILVGQVVVVARIKMGVVQPNATRVVS
jgi:hypothetical protein